MWPPDFSDSRATIFQDTRKPLLLPIRYVTARSYWVTTQNRTGASALGLQRVLELKSYKHRLDHRCIRLRAEAPWMRRRPGSG